MLDQLKVGRLEIISAAMNSVQAITSAMRGTSHRR